MASNIDTRAGSLRQTNGRRGAAEPPAQSLRAGVASARAFARAADVKAETPAMLTCAVSGGVSTGNPNQPLTREDVIAEAVAAAQAGASIVHIHARTQAGETSQASEDYAAIKQSVREQAGDVVLNFTTGGELDASAEERRVSLAVGPEMATLNCGSMNFGSGDEVLLNRRSQIDQLAREMAARGIVPEYECFDMGMAATAAELARAAFGPEGGPGGMMHMLLGILGGAPATPAAVTLFAEIVPPGVPWMVTAIRRHFPTMALTLALGGHVRTGLEDVVYVAPGEYAQSNAQLFARARAMCEAVGRPVATPAQARELLGVGDGQAGRAGD
jgi:3-keto-5-aminohexanoate cleavage enzyme